jgi:trans-aconitate 2-methyltransferase
MTPQAKAKPRATKTQQAGGGCVSGTDWNAAAYDDLSDPMFEWGMAVLGTLELQGDERVLDAGCGSGRLTEELLRRVPRGNVVALDFSPKMLEQAEQRLAKFGGRVEFVHASLQEFGLATKVDGIFSNAVFHWVPDHRAMFRCLHGALKPGGWLVAQFGGVGNLEKTYRRAHEVAAQARFHSHLKGIDDGPHFEDPASTQERMEAAGFRVSEARLHTVSVRFERKERFEAFLKTVVLREKVAKLTEALQREFLEEVSGRTQHDEGAYLLDYVRLTVGARAEKMEQQERSRICQWKADMEHQLPRGEALGVKA